MTELHTKPVIPEFHQGDRMKKALQVSGIRVGEMAEYLGVTRDALTKWMNGSITPKKQTVRLWAQRTGVPLEWIETGEVRHQGLEPRTRWFEASLTRAGLELAA